jgi:hypothetical protein
MLVYRMRETPAAFAALMTLVCWATSWPTSLPETSSSRSAPASAASKVSGPGVVRRADLHAHGGQASGLAPGAHHGNDVGGGHAAGQQLLNRETPHMA